MPRRTDPDQDEDHGYDGPSKTMVKKAMLDLTQLGLDLLELPPERLDAVEMDDNVREALEELRRTTAHGARQRQMRYLGKLLRNAEPEPLRQALADYQASRVLSARAHHEVEQWRERLLAGDEGLNEWLAAHPAGDTPALRAQLRDARREVAQGSQNEPNDPGSGTAQVQSYLQARGRQDALQHASQYRESALPWLGV